MPHFVSQKVLTMAAKGVKKSRSQLQRTNDSSKGREMRITNVLVAAAGLAVVLMTPSTASASTTGETAYKTAAGTTYYKTYSTEFIACRSGRLCLYTAPNYRGLQVSWPAGNATPDFQTIKCAPGWCQSNDDFNDEASSWANNATGMTYCVSLNADNGSANNDMPTGMQANFGTGWDNETSRLSYQGC